MAEVLRYLGNRQDCRVWRNNTGQIGSVKFGLKGSADILGLTCTGRFLAVECKSTNGRQTEAQVNFQRMVEQHCGIYLLVRDVCELHGVSFR